MRHLLLFFLLLPGLCLAEPKLVEADEAAKDPSFLAYRKELLAAVRRRDLTALSAALDPQIHYSFGIEKPGREGFYAAWKVKKGDPSLWKEMEEVLVHGGAFGNNGEFVAPWIYARWPEQYDSLDYVAVLAPKATIYSKPGGKGKVLAVVGHTMLKVGRQDPREHPGWMEVEAPNKKHGYVKADLTRGGLDFRAVFEKKNGKWKMITFIGGD